MRIPPNRIFNHNSHLNDDKRSFRIASTFPLIDNLQGWDSCGSVRRPESDRDFSDPVVFGQKGSVLVPDLDRVWSLACSIVGRTGLRSRFTRYISGRTDSVLGLPEISNIW
jgi:hypothetical protein